MSYILRFQLLGLPRMANIHDGKSHWRYADQERKKWQSAVEAEVLQAGKPFAPLKRAKLTLIRFSSVEPDFDGLVRGMKSIVDGLVRSGVLEDDKLSNTGPWNCLWEKTLPKAGRVVVIVEEEPCMLLEIDNRSSFVISVGQQVIKRGTKC